MLYSHIIKMQTPDHDICFPSLSSSIPPLQLHHLLSVANTKFLKFWLTPRFLNTCILQLPTLLRTSASRPACTSDQPTLKTCPQFWKHSPALFSNCWFIQQLFYSLRLNHPVPDAVTALDKTSLNYLSIHQKPRALGYICIKDTFFPHST